MASPPAAPTPKSELSMSDPPCAAADICEASPDRALPNLSSGSLPMPPKAAPIASMPPAVELRLSSEDRMTGTPTDISLRTAPSGTPNAPATFEASIGVTAPVTNFIISIVIPSSKPCQTLIPRPITRLVGGLAGTTRPLPFGSESGPPRCSYERYLRLQAPQPGIRARPSGQRRVKFCERCLFGIAHPDAAETQKAALGRRLGGMHCD